MEYDINRNGSGYYDPTAFEAMKNCMKGVKKEMNICKGEIYEVEFNNGSLREAIVLSVHGKFSTILCLTENDSLPISVNCRGMKYVDPGMLQYVHNDKIRDFIRTMTDQEYDHLLWAVVDSLGYHATEPAYNGLDIKVKEPEKVETDSEAKLELAKIEAERDVYKSLYENLIDSMINR